jgi:hypothetical protein
MKIEFLLASKIDVTKSKHNVERILVIESDFCPREGEGISIIKDRYKVNSVCFDPLERRVSVILFPQTAEHRIGKIINRPINIS